MIRPRVLVPGILLALAPLAVLAAPAHAADHGKFAVVERIDFTQDPVVATFTALPPLCPEGTFVDDVSVVDEGDTFLKLDIDSVFTCADGSGTFNAKKRITITFVSENSSFSTGRVRLTGGTGRYARLRGVGTDNGVAVDGIGHGALTGTLKRGPR